MMFVKATIAPCNPYSLSVRRVTRTMEKMRFTTRVNRLPAIKDRILERKIRMERYDLIECDGFTSPPAPSLNSIEGRIEVIKCNKMRTDPHPCPLSHSACNDMDRSTM